MNFPALIGSILSAAFLATVAAAQDPVRTENVNFAPGASGTTINGKITGRESALYKLAAEAGQSMHVQLSSTNSATYFNLYAPGRGLGDEAIANGSMTPELNLYDGVLPQSGTYTIAVYLYRSAARRGEVSSYAIDVSIAGATGEVVTGDFADGLQGGPDFFAVRTTGGGTLNVRAAPSAGAAVVGRLAGGTVVRNLGCRAAEGRTWCNIATQADPGLDGWAASDYLVEGTAPDGGYVTQLPEATPEAGQSADALVPGTNYNATGLIQCSHDLGVTLLDCEFGVVREGNGNGSVSITWPDGGTRVIYFENGTPVSYDQSQAEAGATMAVTKDGDTAIVTIGDNRFLIPDAVIWGG